MSKGKSAQSRSLNDNKIIYFFHIMTYRKVLLDKMNQDCYHFILDFYHQKSLIKFSSKAYNYLRHIQTNF